MRASSLIQVIGAFSIRWMLVEGHPICYYDSRPNDEDQVLTFCPEPQFGACCNDLEEAAIKGLYESAGTLNGTCAYLYKEVSSSLLSASSNRGVGLA